jgi:carbon-monoxide dehydrogenase medium subunit
MKPSPFSYHCPRTLDEALDLLASLENARVLAGGQSLVPMLNLRLASPEHLIDLGRLDELVGIAETAQGIAIGAMTTQHTIERSALIEKRCPLLTEAIGHVGHQQTRNRGTIGGSLCHLDPAAELPVVATALDATLEIVSKRGRRRIRFAEFPVGYLTSQLHHDELLSRIDFPMLDAGAGWAFVEFSRRPADFAIVSVAALIVMSKGTIAQARIAVGGLGAAPRRADTAERYLIGQGSSATLIDSAASLVAAGEAEGDALYPGEYRAEIAGVMTRRALEKAFRRAQSGDHA